MSKVKSSPNRDEITKLGDQAKTDPEALEVLRDAYEAESQIAPGSQYDLLNKPVLYMGVNFIFVGILRKVTLDQVLLEDPALVFDTGEWDAKEWANVRSMCTPFMLIERAGGGGMIPIPKSKLIPNPRAGK